MKNKRSKRRIARDSKIDMTRVSDHIAIVSARAEDVKAKVEDGFANFVSKVGVNPEMDNQLSQGHYFPDLLTRNRVQLEWAYRGNWVVGAICDIIAEDMTRAGVEITTSDAAEDIQDFQAGLTRLQIWGALCDIIKWARLYGGSAGVLMVKGQSLDSPLRIETIGKGQFTGISVYDRWQLYPDLTSVISDGPDIGLPAYYYIVTSNSLLANDMTEGANLGVGNMLSTGLKVHHSRVIRQIGVKLPFFQAITEMGWGSSEIERVYDRLISFDNATMSAANLINHAHLRTVGVDGLREILSTGGKAEEGLIKMFEYMRLLQSSEGLTLLDKNDEFKTTAYSFAGLSDMLLQFGQQLSGASGIPMVRFYGQSPAGLNSTGESDIRNYYDNINTKQEANLRPGVDKIIRVAWQSLFGRPAPKDLQFEFTPLWQLSAVEKANVGQTVTNTVTSAYESGLVSRSTSIKELRQASSETGLFSNITDEDIVDAEKEDDVPMPSDLNLDIDEDVKPEPDLEGDIDPSASLNGAQVTSMLSIINQVSQGQLPRETAVKMMAAAFPISAKEASDILGKVGKGFKPEQAITDSIKPRTKMTKLYYKVMGR